MEVAAKLAVTLIIACLFTFGVCLPAWMAGNHSHTAFVVGQVALGVAALTIMASILILVWGFWG